MEDDKLKDLFSNFNPEISSDFKFMDRLQQNIKSVELIKQQSAELRTRNKKAVAIAGIVGFIAGMLFSMALPYIGNAGSNINLSLPAGIILNLSDYYPVLAWAVVGGVSVLTALNTYEISLSLMKAKHANA